MPPTDDTGSAQLDAPAGDDGLGRRERVHAALSSYLRREGLRGTAQRRRILDAFLDAGGHLTHEELAARLARTRPRLGQATIYRAMKLFVEAGIVTRHAIFQGSVQYELEEPGGAHHDHVVCSTCGRIFEFHDPVIEERQEQLARRFGMRIVSHRHVIVGECLQVGRCEDCSLCHQDAGVGTPATP